MEINLETNAEAYSTIRNLLNIGEAPDIFYSWISDVDYYGFAEEGLLYPVDDLLDQQNYEAINTNESGAWTSDAVKEVVGRFADMVADGYVNPGSLSMDHIQSQIDFISHNDAFVSSGSWLESEMGDQWPAAFELTPFFAPAESAGGATSTTAVVECMILPKHALWDL